VIEFAFDLSDAASIGVGALAGLAVGLERELSGHATGPTPRFAGIRTFLLIGGISGIAGWVAGHGLPTVGTALAVGMAALITAAYVVASRPGGEAVDGTTEVAALAVVAIGVVAGLGLLALAGGATAVVALALGEKERIRGAIRHIDRTELQAALQFAVLALVILPVLPAGPYGPFGGVRPQSLWAVVLLFTALNFAGYIARRAAGTSVGYPIAGMIGGTVSSTAVALGFAHRSRETPTLAGPLGAGVIGASTVLLLRLLVVVTILNGQVAWTLLRFLVIPLAAGIAITVVAFRRVTHSDASPVELQNPLGLWGAIKMAAAFQIVLMVVHFVNSRFGHVGVLTSATVLGLTDMDALTLAMTRMGIDAPSIVIAARAITVGVISNTLVKLALTVIFGTKGFRRVASTGLAALGVATAIGLWLGW
jgi:uncharacterized membrane protein (DUF4010 family)